MEGWIGRWGIRAMAGGMVFERHSMWLNRMTSGSSRTMVVVVVLTVSGDDS